MKLVAKIMETIGKTNNFHEFWRFGFSEPSEAIIPDIMKIMETSGFTEVSHGFCYQLHGNIHVFAEELCQNLGFPVSLKPMPPKHMNHK